MTVRIYAKHPPYNDGRLAIVHDEMELAGQPTIRVVEFNDKFCAIEGSHRLYLCNKYGFIPKIFVVNPDVEGFDKEFYEELIKSLPCYEFEHVLKMTENDFELLIAGDSYG